MAKWSAGAGGVLVSCGAIPAGACALLRRRPSSFQFVAFSGFRSSPITTSAPALRFYSRAEPMMQVFALSRVSDASDEDEDEDEEEFLVVNFYKFVGIDDPKAEVSKHLSFLEGLDIHGRVYLSEQGINAQFSGPTKDALTYVEWMREDVRFNDLLVQLSPAMNGHAFPRLKLRYKSSLVQMEGGITNLPLLDPMMRAIPLAPSEWRERLQTMDKINKPLHKQDTAFLGRKTLLLDVRNGYEWDVGHFQGAERPDIDCFRSTSFGLSEKEDSASDPLAGIDKDGTDVLMYCTGGIRCDVYSAILRQRGFQNLYTLSGGVSNYLKSEGPAEWVGNLFVFDSRLSLPPPIYKPDATIEGRPENTSESSTLGRCYICESDLLEFRHRNCANLDCNLLFLSCNSCVKNLRGCCCLECTNAPRVRPALPGHQRYEKWHIYRDTISQNE